MGLDNPIDGQFGGRTRKKTTGEFVRDYLDAEGQAFVAQINRAYNHWCDENGYNGCSYQSMRNVLYLLRREGLIVESAREPSGPKGFVERRYYKIHPDADHDHPAWSDPRGYVYGRE